MYVYIPNIRAYVSNILMLTSAGDMEPAPDATEGFYEAYTGGEEAGLLEEEQVVSREERIALKRAQRYVVSHTQCVWVEELYGCMSIIGEK